MREFNFVPKQGFDDFGQPTAHYSVTDRESGELICYILRSDNSCGRDWSKYYLADLAGVAITLHGRRLGIATKAEFEGEVRSYLKMGCLPTAEEIGQRDGQWTQAVLDAECRVKEPATAMLLVALEGLLESRDPLAVNRAKTAIALATGSPWPSPFVE